MTRDSAQRMVERYKEVYDIIGNNIKKFREEKKWTQSDLADRCQGVNRTKISKMENGQVNYLLSSLLEVCDALGKTLKEISS
jgi:transcriptional regulator with XRE-family HTH domain